MRTLLTRGGTLLAALTLIVAGAAPVAASSRTYSSIGTGENHACGLTARGRAYCWGENDHGQLGDGTTDNSGVNGPQRVIGGLKFTSISVGEYDTCGLTSSGAAYCWGSGYYGELGDGTTTDDSGVNGPQRVIGGLKFTSISAGNQHTCGLTSRGAAYCWGRNADVFDGDGALGDGTTDDSGVNGPQRVIGGLKFTSISAGKHHTCGLTARGRAYCWGGNVYGELGDGTTDDSRVNGPQRVIGGLKFTSISAGNPHTCGLTARGRAYCWGRNVSGALGDGTEDASGVNGPQRVIGGLKFTSISVGVGHTCGLTARRKAYCWGYGGYGQLGNGTEDASGVNGPQRVIGGLKFASISASDYFTCGLTSRGAARCWADEAP